MAVERTALTPKEAAGMISVSVQWLYLKLRQGEGPRHRRRGNLYLIEKNDLLEWDKQPVIP